MDSLFHFNSKSNKKGADIKQVDPALIEAMNADPEFIPQGVDILSRLGDLNIALLIKLVTEINESFSDSRVSIRKYAEIYIYWT